MSWSRAAATPGTGCAGGRRPLPRPARRASHPTDPDPRGWAAGWGLGIRAIRRRKAVSTPGIRATRRRMALTSRVRADWGPPLHLGQHLRADRKRPLDAGRLDAEV